MHLIEQKACNLLPQVRENTQKKQSGIWKVQKRANAAIWTKIFSSFGKNKFSLKS